MIRNINHAYFVRKAVDGIVDGVSAVLCSAPTLLFLLWVTTAVTPYLLHDRAMIYSSTEIFVQQNTRMYLLLYM